MSFNIYYLIQHDYKSNESKIIMVGYRRNLLFAMEEIIENFLDSKVGINDKKYYNKNDKGRKFGYFIERNSVSKLKVRHKYIKNGYFINTVIIEKIISLEVVGYTKHNIKSNEEDNYKYINSFGNIVTLPRVYSFNKEFDDVIKELKEKNNINQELELNSKIISK